MQKIMELHFEDVEENEEYKSLINKVLKKCFETEHINDLNLYINIILTTPQNIRTLNKEYRNIDKETDVLSFPMFEKNEIDDIIEKQEKMLVQETIGDIIVSVERVHEQAEEYGHSFERELSYMIVHGFYHLMGYDHMEEDDKKVMRAKEDIILNDLKILR